MEVIFGVGFFTFIGIMALVFTMVLVLMGFGALAAASESRWVDTTELCLSGKRERINW